MSVSAPVAASIRALRAFVVPRPKASACTLCGASIPEHPRHAHLWAKLGGRIVCACGACALLLGHEEGAPYRRLPTSVRALSGLVLGEGDWQALGVPIRLAFFVRRPETVVECVYPSPAGPVKSPLAREQSELLAARCPLFAEFQPDVEALLLCELGARQGAFRLPIDECFRLVGLVRRHWRGASGGAPFWAELDVWLAELGAREGGSRA